MIKKRWQVSEDNVTWTREVHPLNAKKLTISESRDLDAGQVFFRKKIGQEIEFWDKTPGKDYTYFRSFERRRNGRCQTLYVRLQIKCNRQWSTYWTGQFSTGSGKWDLDNCIFSVKPETTDRYTCLMQQMDEKKNVLEAPAFMTMVYNGPGLEFFGCAYDDDTGSPCSTPSGTGWTLLDDYVMPLEPGNILCRVWVRKRATTLCVGGSGVAPGTGWNLLSNDCASNGTATYVKGLTTEERAEILVNVQSPNLTQGDCVDGEATPPPQPFPGIPSAATSWVLILGCSDPDYPGYWLPLGLYSMDRSIIGPGASRTGRRLVDVMDLLLAPCITEGNVRSDFLGINPPGDTTGYVEGENYVTGAATETANIVICQKSDIAVLDSSESATRGMMTLGEIFTAMRVMYRLLYDVLPNGTVRIEHYKWWQTAAGFNLSEFEEVIEPLVYEHKRDEIPGIERLKFMEARNDDFVGSDIVYSGECVDKSKTEEISPGKITTDVGLILASPQDVSKDGFVFLSCSYANGIYSTVVREGALTGDYAWNAPMSTANLQRDFWTWDRLRRTGRMNDQDVTFDAAVNSIQQEDVKAAVCCKIIRMDAKKSLGTALGTRLGGIRASVEDVEYDLSVDRVQFTLSYDY
jgi:hypothetical protein